MKETGPICPKCSRPARGDEEACARCGLLRSRWEGYDVRPAPHAVVDPLWELALADWDNQKRHTALAAAISSSGDWKGLSVLAQRYSAVLRQRPKDPIATAALDHLIQMAMGLPLPRTSQDPTLLSQVLKVGLALLMMVATAYFVFTLVRH